MSLGPTENLNPSDDLPLASGEANDAAPKIADRDEPCDAQPVQSDERVQAIDVLRGAALLGILAMNIVLFAWPSPGYENPRFSGGEASSNVGAWVLNSFVFSGKMMSLFSMLFGAGLVLMTDRASARGSRIVGVYYRRIGWLLVIGLVHGYLIWMGDILVMYALCGLLLYLFRNLSPRRLIALGVVLLAIQSAIGFGFVMFAQHAAATAEQVDVDKAAGVTPKDWQLELHATWNEGLRAIAQPNQEDYDKEMERYTGSYLRILRERAPELLMFQIFGFLLFMLWGAGGRMLLGMALMKLGVFSGQRTWSFYRSMAIGGYATGLPLTAIGVFDAYRNHYELLNSPIGVTAFGLGMVPTALGHAAVVLMICKAGLWTRLTERLAAVGRMALTNYLMQSVLCTTFFYGYGLGMFGQFDRVGLWIIVFVVWGIQLMISPIWLTYFKYGPAEWIWRSLTYWRWQPLRQSASV